MKTQLQEVTEALLSEIKSKGIEYYNRSKIIDTYFQSDLNILVSCICEIWLDDDIITTLTLDEFAIQTKDSGETLEPRFTLAELECELMLELKKYYE